VSVPRLTCLTPTVRLADKLPYLMDLYDCLLAQSMYDWEWIVMADVAADYEILQARWWDERVRVVFDDLADVDRSARHPIPTLYNRWYPQAKGEFLMAAFDDDLLHPDIFKVYTEYFDANPQQLAAYVSMQHQSVDRPGVSDTNRTYWIPAGPTRRQGMLDCQIDGGQTCIRRELLDLVPAPWWPETTEHDLLRHCDGRYLDHMAQATDFPPCGDPNTAYVVHRFTPVSTFTNNIGVVHG
jgi:hypothetical protein